MLKPYSVHAIHVIAGLHPAHGGPSYTVPRLCAALADAGAEVAMHSVASLDVGSSNTAFELLSRSPVSMEPRTRACARVNCAIRPDWLAGFAKPPPAHRSSITTGSGSCPTCRLGASLRR
jgi:hypothetical protein